MEDQHCPTMWSTYKIKGNEKYDGRRHGCRFPKGHKGSICMCVCGRAHKNIDVKEKTDALV